MAYVGNQPVPQATQTRNRFVATSGQTSFATSGYTPNFVDVYLDGVKLDSSEYTATNGSDVVLASGASTGQIMEVVAFSSFDVADIRNMTQPLGLKNYTTTERNALTGIGAGDTIYNSTIGSIEFYDGFNWIATNLIPVLNSVTGTIYTSVSGTLTLSVSNTTDTVDVKYYEGSTLLATDASVAVSSGSLTSTIPSAVYGQSAGDTISIQVFNLDGTPSNAIDKTVVDIPTGGTITTSGSYRVHTFTSSSSFVVPSGLSLSNVEYLVIAGGGGGGGHSANGYYNDGGGGGGAGGYRNSVSGETSGGNSSAETALSLSAGSYTVTIGAGGTSQSNANANNGSNSVFGSITSTGGGGGATVAWQPPQGVSGNAGGSGGGSGSGYQLGTTTGASGTSGQGFKGGDIPSSAQDTQCGAGGGGAGQVGGNVTSSGATSVPGVGGNGLASSINGTSTTRAGGGGAGGVNGNGISTGSAGGSGGGGKGGDNATTNHTSGTANTGSGGGGSGGATTTLAKTGGNGGSGIVIVRYQL